MVIIIFFVTPSEERNSFSPSPVADMTLSIGKAAGEEKAQWNNPTG
jgi:hypothetical protein